MISTSVNPYYYEGGSWKSAGNTNSYSWDYNVSAVNVSLDEYNDKLKDHLHVITYNNPTWEVYNELFLNTVSASSNTTIYESIVMNKVNTSSYTSVNIYQFPKNKTLDYKKSYNIGNPNLRQGMVLF